MGTIFTPNQQTALNKNQLFPTKDPTIPSINKLNTTKQKSEIKSRKPLCGKTVPWVQIPFSPFYMRVYSFGCRLFFCYRGNGDVEKS